MSGKKKSGSGSFIKLMNSEVSFHYRNHNYGSREKNLTGFQSGLIGQINKKGGL